MSSEAESAEVAKKRTSLDKGLELLVQLSRLNVTDEVRLVDLAQAADLPEPTAHRLLRILSENDFVAREETGGYRLGNMILVLAAQLHGSTNLRRAALPILHKLVEQVDTTVHLAVRNGNTATYIEKLEGTRSIRLASAIGQSVLLHSSGIGKALLAFSGEKVIGAVIEDGLVGRTPHTITKTDDLRQELALIRERGYAIDEEENELGVRCVAAPIFNRHGEVTASMSVAGTLDQVPRSKVSKIAKLVREASHKISEYIGYLPTVPT